MEVPCFGCVDRHVACHSVCDRYIDWQQQRQKTQQVVFEKREKDTMCYDIKRRAIRRIKHK